MSKRFQRDSQDRWREQIRVRKGESNLNNGFFEAHMEHSSRDAYSLDKFWVLILKITRLGHRDEQNILSPVLLDRALRGEIEWQRALYNLEGKEESKII